MSVLWNMGRVQQVDVLTGECSMEHGPCRTGGGTHR